MSELSMQWRGIVEYGLTAMRRKVLKVYVEPERLCFWMPARRCFEQERLVDSRHEKKKMEQQ